MSLRLVFVCAIDLPLLIVDVYKEYPPKYVLAPQYWESLLRGGLGFSKGRALGQSPQACGTAADETDPQL